MINSIKTFLSYLFIKLFDQKMNFFDFLTNEEKFKTIILSMFLYILISLKHYLSFIK